MNSLETLNIFYSFQYYWDFPAFVLYDLYHFTLMYLELRKIDVNICSNKSSPSIGRPIAISGIMHCIISIIANTIYCFIFPMGIYIALLLFIVGLHVCVNWKTPAIITDKILRRDFENYSLTLSKYATPSTKSRVIPVSFVNDTNKLDDPV